MSNKTPLYDEHKRLNGRIVDFADWEMPVQYDSIPAEHQAVRESVGIFDVCHMGRFFLSGPGAAQGLSQLVVTRIEDMKQGDVRYSLVCNPEGGIKDDVLVTCLGENSFLVVVNASNREKLLPWFKEHLRGKDILTDHTTETGMIAIQGPESETLTKKLLGIDFSNLGYYQAMKLDNDSILSRTGYTGENGYEIITPADCICEYWQKTCALGAKPCGLGSRDILRLEMGFPLYGHELNEDISPLEAGVKWAVHLDKTEFIGKEALEKQLADGLKRKRLAFQLIDRGIPRENCTIYDGDNEIGKSTSGGFSPLLKKGIGLALVDREWKQDGELTVEIRGKKVPIERKKLPFVPKRVK